MSIKRFEHPCADKAECREAEIQLARLLRIPLRQSLGMSEEPSQHPRITEWRQHSYTLHMALYDGDAAVAVGARPADDPVTWHYRHARVKARDFRPGDYLHSNHASIPVPAIADPSGGPLTCEVCRGRFSAIRSDARICSARCRKTASRAA